MTSTAQYKNNESARQFSLSLERIPNTNLTVGKNWSFIDPGLADDIVEKSLNLLGFDDIERLFETEILNNLDLLCYTYLVSLFSNGRLNPDQVRIILDQLLDQLPAEELSNIEKLDLLHRVVASKSDDIYLIYLARHGLYPILSSPTEFRLPTGKVLYKIGHYLWTDRDLSRIYNAANVMQNL